MGKRTAYRRGATLVGLILSSFTLASPAGPAEWRPDALADVVRRDEPPLNAPPLPDEPPPNAPPQNEVPPDAAALFRADKVWSVELRVTPQAWAAMEPKGGGNVFGLMASMAAGNEGRGPADLLAAAMAARGDRDGDGRLGRAEFDALAAR